ncbi:leucine zipper domain-containing protein [Bordetella holmesii]|uniref:leucine zipper domain-containing protein n=1 Tax=Bordetella holmesii TaxID=35814 RepID=UPI003AF320C3
MNTHKHARLTFLRRLEMVQQLIAHQVCVPEAPAPMGSPRRLCANGWAASGSGPGGLADASSRPTVSPRAIAPPRRWLSWSCAASG